MLSSTATSSSYSNNSIISDSSSLHSNQISHQQELKKRRKKSSQFHSNSNIKNKLLYNENLNKNYSLNINNKNSSSNTNQFIMKTKKNRNRNENQNDFIKNSKMQEVPVSSNRRNLRSIESSELSSNNLTCSELETSSNRSCPEVRLQRRKLIKCILREDIDLLKNLLAQHDILTIRDKHWNTLMHIACGFGRLKSVQTLMKLCPKLIEQSDDKGHNPIDVAIKHGQTDVIKWLLTKTNRLAMDSQTNNQNSNSTTHRSCLHIAAKHGENEILRFILSEMYKQQFSLDIQDLNGNTAAHLAAKYNHLDCLQTLVEYNCDVTILNKNGHTPCFVAEYYGNEECVHYLMIVETCINLSIKIVKIGRKLRETKTNNEILKAQMDEAIAINNDFINQRENVMNISLDLMQRQLNELESKIVNEIERLQYENCSLIETIEQINKNNTKNINDNCSSSFSNDDKVIEIHIEKAIQDSKKTNSLGKLNNMKSLNNSSSNQSSSDVEIASNNYNSNFKLIESELNSCKQELINTKQNCNKVLKMDQKRLDSVKSRFNEIKLNIETNENHKCNMSNCDNSDIIETKEHFEILRKMYQETTYKLMIFRNALKERQIAQPKLDSNSSNSNSSNNSIKGKNSFSSENDNLSQNFSSSQSNASTNGNNGQMNCLIANKYMENNLNETDELNDDHEGYCYQSSNSNSNLRPLSSTPNSIKNNLNNNYYCQQQQNSYVNSNNMNKFTAIPANTINEDYEYSSDETLSDNDYELDEANYEGYEDEEDPNRRLSENLNRNNYEDSNNDEFDDNYLIDDDDSSDQQSAQTIIENYTSSKENSGGWNNNNKNNNNQIYKNRYNENTNNRQTNTTTKKTTNIYSIAIDDINKVNSQVIIEEIGEERIQKKETEIKEIRDKYEYEIRHTCDSSNNKSIMNDFEYEHNVVNVSKITKNYKDNNNKNKNLSENSKMKLKKNNNRKISNQSISSSSSSSLSNGNNNNNRPISFINDQNNVILINDEDDDY